MHGVAVASITGTALALMSALPAGAIEPGDDFYVPKPNHGAIRQIAQLTSAGQHDDAELVRRMIGTPQAVWLEQGSPKEVRQQARQIVARARAKDTLPVFVAYNIPFRDCAQYSAGGATSVAEYQAWIDGVAAGIGRGEAAVILEPDGLGIIPWYTNLFGQLEWCQPTDADPATAAADRFAMLNYAVDVLTALPNVEVYLDGTHSAWLGVGDIADRLIKAGVARTDGFFVNVSNYQTTERQLKYGSWISQCVDLVLNAEYEPASCASQYYPANPADFSTWVLTDQAYAAAYAQANLTPDPDRMAHFVVDTSRNGQGPWTPPPGVYPDPQDWCNPPGRGLGLRPTTDTGNPLADAFLWIKTPGESDGQCSRGLTDTGGVDPEWGIVDPPAGAWFPQQALQLARLANPPL